MIETQDLVRQLTTVKVRDAEKEIERLTAERDMLVEALEKIVDTDQDSVLAWVLHDIANEALAKVKK